MANIYTYKLTIDGVEEPVEIRADTPEEADWYFGKMMQEAAGISEEPPAPEPESEPQAPPTPGAYMPGNSGNPYAPGGPMGFGAPEHTRAAAVGLVQPAVGLGQTATAAGEWLGILDQGSTEEYSKAAEDVLSFLRGPDPTGNNEKISNAVEFATNFGVSMLVAPARGAGFLKTVGTSAVGGAFGAAAMFEKGADLAEKSHSVALGALLGGGLQFGISSFPRVKKAISDLYVKSMTEGADPRYAAAMEQLTELIPGLKDELTIGQMTGAPRMLAFESESAAKEGFAAYRRQIERVHAALKDFGDRWGGIWNPEELGAIAAKRGPVAMRKVIQDITNRGKIEWDALHDAATAIVTHGKKTVGGLKSTSQDLIEMPNLWDNVVEVARRFGLPTDRKQLLGALSPELKAMLHEFEVFERKGLSLDGWIAARKATNGNLHVVNSQLKDAANTAFGRQLKKALDAAIDPDNPQYAQIKDLLNAADAAYAANRMEVYAVRRSASAKHLGLKMPAPNPREALGAIGKMKPEDAGRTAEWLAKHDPDLLSEMRGEVWRDVMEAAEIGGAGIADMDVPMFAKEMLKILGPAKGGTMAGRPSPQLVASIKQFSSLFPPEDAAELQFLLPRLQAMFQHMPAGGAPPNIKALFQTIVGAVPGVGGSGGALNSVQRGAPFLAREFYMFSFFKKPDKMLFTKEGRQFLMEAYRSADNPQRLIRVLTQGMVYAMGDEELNDQASNAVGF